jgi:hypothetical protein
LQVTPLPTLYEKFLGPMEQGGRNAIAAIRQFLLLRGRRAGLSHKPEDADAT